MNLFGMLAQVAVAFGNLSDFLQRRRIKDPLKNFAHIFFSPSVLLCLCLLLLGLYFDIC